MHKQNHCSGGDAPTGCDTDAKSNHIIATSIVAVSNLPGAFDSTDLEAMFREVGPLLDCFVINDQASDTTRRGFVYLTNTQDAEKAIQQKNGFTFSGKDVVVERAYAQIVIFGGIQNSCVAGELIRQAREVGSVISVNYPLTEKEMDLYGLTQYGCRLSGASVLFADDKSANLAVSCLHHKEFEGVTVWARSLGEQEKLESVKDEQPVLDTKEKVWCTAYSESTGIVDQRVKMLLSESTKEYDPNVDFYGGPQIFNTVTWSLNGSAETVKAGHLYATGHQRAWNFKKGKFLDVSPVMGPDMAIFTTAEFGTFYLTVTFEDHYVTLPIDGREGWNYGFENQHGCFEYYHQALDNPYLADRRNWSMLTDCHPDYSVRGLCPTDHGDVKLGIPALRRACKDLSTYKGHLPVPPEVRKACATLITYGPEAMKSNEALDWTSGTLVDERKEYILKNLHPFASPRIKRWSSLGRSKLHYLVRWLDGEEDIWPIMPAVTGISTTKGILDSVCVLTYNRLLPPNSSKARDWTSFPLDPDADMAGGRPHFLSPQFARPWPTNTELAASRSPDSMIDRCGFRSPVCQGPERGFWFRGTSSVSCFDQCSFDSSISQDPEAELLCTAISKCGDLFFRCPCSL